MLLSPEKKTALVNSIIDAAKALLERDGRKMVDPATGFEHLECRSGKFVLIEHQRQTLPGGTIKTNGLDVWQVVEGDAKKLLSVSYIPFNIKFLHASGKAEWIQELVDRAPANGSKPS